MLTNVLSRLLHDPVSVYLLAGDVLATIAVGLGIIWEHGPSDIRVVANRLVIGGIIVETVCSVLLFAYDANIIGDQNDTIISLLDALTPPQLEYGEFSRDLAGIAPVPIIIEAEPDSNSQFFAADLSAAFRQAEWSQRSIVNEAMSFIPGVWVKYLSPPPASGSTKKIAQAICLALNAQLLTKARVIPAMTLKALREWQRAGGVSEDVWNLQHPDNKPSAQDWPDSAPAGAVIIHIGSNRNNFFFNNARRKKGLNPLPDIRDAGPPCGR